MSAVTILTYGAKSDSGTGSAVDVSGFSTLRLNAKLVANFGKEPQLRLAIDTGPTSEGPWTEIEDRGFQARAWPANSVCRFVLAGFDNYVRARWSGHATANVAWQNTSAELSIGIDGDGQPDAE